MAVAEFSTRMTIWIALVLYAWGEVGRLRWRVSGRSGSALVVWWVSALGFGFYVGHVLLAFGVFHDWSHAAAYRFTAEATERLVGWRWGGGLLFNHLFTGVWLGELIAWRIAPGRYRRRPVWVDWLVRWFFIFMITNGAVVFVEGPQRWIGVGIVVLLALGGFVGRSPWRDLGSD